MCSPGPKRCPLCSIRVVQVTWNHGNDFFVLGSGTDDNGPFIRDDEVVRESMGEVEQERRRELRRLRNLEDYGMEPVPTYTQPVLIFNEKIANADILSEEAIVVFVLLLLLWWGGGFFLAFGEKNLKGNHAYENAGDRSAWVAS